MTRISHSIAIAAMLACGIAIAAEPEYRLAGIIALEDGNALALIELPDGEQRLFRDGDTLDNGRVIEIQPTSVRLEFPNRDLLLELAGTGLIVVDEPDAYRPEDYVTTGTHQVPTSKLMEITRLADSEEDKDAKIVALRVMNHLNLPPDARITAVSDQPVSSLDQALKAMAQRIEETADETSPAQFVLSISDAAGKKRMYVFGGDDEVTHQTVTAE